MLECQLAWWAVLCSSLCSLYPTFLCSPLYCLKSWLKKSFLTISVKHSQFSPYSKDSWSELRAVEKSLEDPSDWLGALWRWLNNGKGACWMPGFDFQNNDSLILTLFLYLRYLWLILTFNLFPIQKQRALSNLSLSRFRSQLFD